jgi:prepilin-type processing-associated H-X9-DG protein
VVITIIALLLALLIPGVSSARESARQTQCRNNLKQLGLACQHYESSHGTLPPGTWPPTATKAGVISFGVSWLVTILPWVEQSTIQKSLDLEGTQGAAIGVCNSSTYGHQFNASVLKGIPIPVYRCPSSPLGEWAWQTSLPEPGPLGIWRPTYAGIAGSADHPTTVYFGSPSVAADPVGWASRGGLVIRTQGVSVGSVADGLSNTLLVGEQSGWCRDATGANRDGRSDHGHGFPMGSNRDAVNLRNWNITTIAYEINDIRWELFGVGFPASWGLNRPIQSAHVGGANVAFGDGSVRFMDERTDLVTLKRLADKDDREDAGAY